MHKEKRQWVYQEGTFPRERAHLCTGLGLWAIPKKGLRYKNEWLTDKKLANLQVNKINIDQYKTIIIITNCV